MNTTTYTDNNIEKVYPDLEFKGYIENSDGSVTIKIKHFVDNIDYTLKKDENGNYIGTKFIERYSSKENIQPCDIWRLKQIGVIGLYEDYIASKNAKINDTKSEFKDKVGETIH